MLQRPSRWTWGALLTVAVLGIVAIVLGAFGQRFGTYGAAFVYTATFTMTHLLVRAHGAALGASLVTGGIIWVTGSPYLHTAVLPIAIAVILELAHLGAAEHRWSARRSYVGALIAVSVPASLFGAGVLLLFAGILVSPGMLISLVVALALTVGAVYLLRRAAPTIIRLFGRDRSAGPAGQH